jgi:hypothetical protein
LFFLDRQDGPRIAPLFSSLDGRDFRWAILAAGEVPADAVRAHLGQVVEAIRESAPTAVVESGVAGRS